VFFGDWLQRREMLSPNKVALIDAVPSASLRTGPSTEFILSKVEGLRTGPSASLGTGNDNQPITYRERNQRANRFANFFQDGLGLHKGDRVSIYAMNRVEYLDALLVYNKLGAILNLVNWRLAVRELEAIINDAAPRVLLYSQEFISQVDALRPRLPTVEHFIGLDQVTSDQASIPEGRCADVRWPTERGNWPKTRRPSNWIGKIRG
jgi:acyl-CoA synthetase (AMP-forming)/AMP-acid ligase II